jgi:hypothetical protein
MLYDLSVGVDFPVRSIARESFSDQINAFHSRCDHWYPSCTSGK